MAVVLCVILFAIAIALLVAGCRGFRVGRAPHCRRCQSQLADEGCDVPSGCSECGQDLTSPRAIQLGSRRKRPLVGWFGVLMFSIAIFWTGAVVWEETRNTNWLPHLPNWWLIHLELDSDDQAWQTAVLTELDDRITKGKLGKSHRLRIINQGLERQLDESAVWRPVWGDIIEQGIIDGFVSDEQARLYWKSIMEVWCRTNNEGVIVLWFRTKRAGSLGRLRSGLAWRVDGLAVNGEEIEIDDLHEHEGVIITSLGSYASMGVNLFELPEDRDADANECVVTVTLGWHRQLLQTASQANPTTSSTHSLQVYGKNIFDLVDVTAWQEDYVVNRDREAKDE